VIAEAQQGSRARAQGSSGAATLTLRPYQQSALEAIRRELARSQSTLVVSAVGTGKTVLFAEVAKQDVQRGERVLVLAHRDELLKQARRKLEAVGIWADVEKGKARASLLSKVVLASVQSLRGARLARYPRDHFGKIIVDEAHHGVAPGYRGVFDHFETAQRLGVTATPDRADGAALGEVFETLAFRYEMRAAIRDGWLAPIAARRVVLDSVDLDTVKTRAGDFAQNELAEIMGEAKALRGVVVPLLELARDRKTIVFAVDVAHAHALADLLNEYRPGSARAVDGTTDEDKREAVLHDFAAGEFQFLVNCALFTEGFDEPSIACVAMCRPTKSRALYVQCIGRGTRQSPETGKRDCLVLDFAGNSGRHKLIGPADCLRGSDEPEIEDDVREEIERLLGAAQLEISKVVDQAAEEAARRRAALAITAVVKYRAENIDPFIGGDDGPAQHEPRLYNGSSDWEKQRPSERQLAALEKAGVTLKKLPHSFTAGDASRLLARFAQRFDRGLCSYKMARYLSQHGVKNTATLAKDRAEQLKNKLFAANHMSSAIAKEPEVRGEPAFAQDGAA
jgi:superfamily II DNA or RNA helicase